MTTPSTDPSMISAMAPPGNPFFFFLFLVRSTDTVGGISRSLENDWSRGEPRREFSTNEFLGFDRGVLGSEPLRLLNETLNYSKLDILSSSRESKNWLFSYKTYNIIIG